MTFNIYIPFVQKGEPYFGTAMAMPPDTDSALLKAQWRYHWSAHDPFPKAQGEFVPMFWTGEPSKKVSYDHDGYILVMNEPDNIKQSNLTPKTASERLKVIKELYPYAKTVAPNTLVYNQDWLKAFVDFGVVPNYYAYHCYVEGPFSVDDIINKTEECHDITGGQCWITEYGSMFGNTEDFNKLTEWMIEQSWIKRIAPFTNRMPNTPYWKEFKLLTMVSDDGILTPMGQVYKNKIV